MNKYNKIKQTEKYTPLGIMYIPNDYSKCKGCKRLRIDYYCEVQICKPEYKVIDEINLNK